MHELTNPDQVFQNTLYSIRRRAIGTESFIKDSTNSRRLSVVMDRLGETTALAMRDLQKHFLFPFAPNHSLSEKLKENDYLNVSGTYINIPYGLKTSFLTYASAIENYVPLILSIPSHLSMVEKYLLKLIGSRTSTSGTLRDRIYDESNRRIKEIEVAKTELANCFDKGSDKGTGNYGHFFSRNADWDIVVEKTSAINKQLKGLDLKKVIAQKDRIEEYSKDLRTELDAGNGRELSAFMAEEISQVLYNAALELEFLSSFFYFCNTLTEVMKKNGEDLDRKLKL